MDPSTLARPVGASAGLIANAALLICRPPTGAVTTPVGPVIPPAGPAIPPVGLATPPAGPAIPRGRHVRERHPQLYGPGYNNLLSPGDTLDPPPASTNPGSRAPSPAVSSSSSDREIFSTTRSPTPLGFRERTAANSPASGQVHRTHSPIPSDPRPSGCPAEISTSSGRPILIPQSRKGRAAASSPSSGVFNPPQSPNPLGPQPSTGPAASSPSLGGLSPSHSPTPLGFQPWTPPAATWPPRGGFNPPHSPTPSGPQPSPHPAASSPFPGRVNPPPRSPIPASHRRAPLPPPPPPGQRRQVAPPVAYAYYSSIAAPSGLTIAPPRAQRTAAGSRLFVHDQIRTQWPSPIFPDRSVPVRHSDRPRTAPTTPPRQTLSRDYLETMARFQMVAKQANVTAALAALTLTTTPTTTTTTTTPTTLPRNPQNRETVARPQGGGVTNERNAVESAVNRRNAMGRRPYIGLWMPPEFSIAGPSRQSEPAWGTTAPTVGRSADFGSVAGRCGGDNAEADGEGEGKGEGAGEGEGNGKKWDGKGKGKGKASKWD